MALATMSAVAMLMLPPCFITSMTSRNTPLGRRSRMTAVLKTLEPKISVTFTLILSNPFLSIQTPRNEKRDKPAPSGHACPLRRPARAQRRGPLGALYLGYRTGGQFASLETHKLQKPPGTGCGIFHEKGRSGANIRLTGGFRPVYCFYQPKPAERGYNYVLHQGRRPPDRGGGRD